MSVDFQQISEVKEQWKKTKKFNFKMGYYTAISESRSVVSNSLWPNRL